MKKIKILITGLSTNLGGIETYIYNLFKKANKEKFEFSFLIFDTSKKVCYEEEILNEGSKFYKITPRTKNYILFLNDLKKVFQNNEFDYIHFNLMDFSCFERIILANKYSKAKIIIHSHNGGFKKNVSIKTRICHELGKRMIKNIPYFKVACGKEAGNFMFDNEKFIVFNNGIDIDKFVYNEKNRKEIRKELKISDQTEVVGSVAKLETQKNPLFLLSIFNEYQKRNNNSVLVLVGEGSLKSKLEKEIIKYNLKDKVFFLGRRTDTNKIYSAFDIYIMPSLYEGFSISLIEAQVNGIKCYTSTNVDKNSNITENVKFISLELSAKKWAEEITNNNNSRDIDVIKKIPQDFISKNSYKKVYEYYIENYKNKEKKNEDN